MEWTLLPHLSALPKMRAYSNEHLSFMTENLCWNLHLSGFSCTKDILPQLNTSDGIRRKIYTIRGVQVMLDPDPVEIYGYETKNFNRQAKNNIEKFPDDMMFQMNQEDLNQLSRCKNFTPIMQTKGIKGGRTSYPYVFTEQGIYMLMTVLKGENQSLQIS